MDLEGAQDADSARKAADVLENYQPPPSVREAIEHFVGTRGYPPDQDFTKYDKLIFDWIDQVCH